MDVPACAVGRLGPEGPWIGFAPTLDDGYALTVASDAGTGRIPAEPADLLALAIVYFEESLPEPPEELAATQGDIGTIVRHAAEAVPDPRRRAAYAEAVDAIDDGLAADVVIDRLARAFGDGEDALPHLRRRIAQVTGAA